MRTVPLRAALAVSASLLALAPAARAQSAPAGAPPLAVSSDPVLTVDGAAQHPDGVIENRYYLMLLAQTFDGAQERSIAQKAGFARLRRADESWITIDYGDGAMAVATPLGLSVGGFLNETPAEVGLAYDYKTHRLGSESAVATYNNRFVAPLLDRSPALGRDARWRLALTPEQIGIGGVSGGAIPLELSRRYFRTEGRDLVLLEFKAPAFSYRTKRGESVVHWAHGLALTDPGFGQIYWTATLQRAVASGEGRPRPYRYARTFYAVDGAGKPLLDIRRLAALQPYLSEFYAHDATAPIPPTGAGATDQTPLELAARLDTLSFSVAENSANQLGELLGSVFGPTAGGVGASIDSLLASKALNNAVLPTAAAPSVLTSALNDLSAQLTFLERCLPPVASQIADNTRAMQTAANAITRLNGLKAELGVQFDKAVLQAKNTTQFEYALSTYGSQLAAVEAKTADAYGGLVVLAGKNATLEAIGAKLASSLPSLTRLVATAQAAKLPQLAASATSLIEKVRPFKPVVNGLSYAANTAAILKNAKLLSQFDPNQKDIGLNGNYSGLLAVAEPLAAMVSTGGDFATGNGKAVALDLTNFIGGRFSDVYMSYLAYDAASQAVKQAELEGLLAKLKAWNHRIAKTNAQIADVDARLDAMASALRSGTGPNAFAGGKFEADGRITIAYWLWMHGNDREGLRQYGIDPNGPIGVYPKPIQSAQNDVQPPRPTPAPPPAPRADPVVITPSSADRPAYPTVDPHSITVKPKPAPPEEPPAEPTEVKLPEVPPDKPTPPRPESKPLKTGMNDLYVTQESTSPLKVTPLDFDPVTFEPVRYTPDTWDPPTWNAPKFDSPKWVPPRFEAPKPSNLPWTDFGDTQPWGGGVKNMAFDYADMSGKVTTDTSAWSKWLATQNVRDLEQLALAAGYPNLASALADASNLVFKAENLGFREWADAIPAVSASVGMWASEKQHLLAEDQIRLGVLLASARPDLIKEPKPSAPDFELCGR